MRGEPFSLISQYGYGLISTHSPRAGRTFSQIISNSIFGYFNSLAPCGANHCAVSAITCAVRISTHSPRAGRTFPHIGSCGCSAPISTHSPRAGRTHIIVVKHIPSQNFNSLAPCGANHRRHIRYHQSSTFQLTRPVRGEPHFSEVPHIDIQFQLTRPVRGEPLDVWHYADNYSISTHSPRAGRTVSRLVSQIDVRDFNSLAPCGANPAFAFCNACAAFISTHSPRAGRTRFSLWRRILIIYFNSLAPCGANL